MEQAETHVEHLAEAPGAEDLGHRALARELERPLRRFLHVSDLSVCGDLQGVAFEGDLLLHTRAASLDAVHEVIVREDHFVRRARAPAYHACGRAPRPCGTWQVARGT